MSPIIRLCHALARAAAGDPDPRSKRLHALALDALRERDDLLLEIARLKKARDDRHDVMTDLA